MTAGASLNDAIRDFTASGLTPDMFGVAWDAILQDISPLDPAFLRQHFPPGKSSLWEIDPTTHEATLRPRAGYIWRYNGAVRVKNLDPAFVKVKHGEPVKDRKTGKPVMHRYLSPPGSASHFYLTPEDFAAAKSPKAIFVDVEGEKKKKWLSLLFRLLSQTTERYAALPSDASYCVCGLQGVFNTNVPEMDIFAGGGGEEFIGVKEFLPYHAKDFKALSFTDHPVWFVFDPEAEINPLIAYAELQLAGGHFLRGATLARMKSLSWDITIGKGIDDYGTAVTRAVTGGEPVFRDGQPTQPRHPALEEFSRLVQAARHPFHRFAVFGLDFVVRATVSALTAGLTMTDSMQETLVDVLQEHGGFRTKRAVIARTVKQAVKVALNERRAASEIPTELRNAEFLAQEYHDRLLYNTERSAVKSVWMQWDGIHWQAHDHAVAIQAAKDVLRRLPDLYGLAPEGTAELKAQVVAWSTQNHLASICNHAATIPGFYRSDTAFDTDPLQLNLLNGVYDFRSGTLLPHAPTYYHAKLAPTAYLADARAPKWRDFLNVIYENTPYVSQAAYDEITTRFPGHAVREFLEPMIGWEGGTYAEEMEDWIGTRRDACMGLTPAQQDLIDLRCRRNYELVRFMQQCFGLSCTGLSNEKIMLFLYGEYGDNGKSTMFNVFSGILGDYFVRIPMKALLNTGNNTNTDAIAEMRGARMVVADEFSDGVMDIAAVKTLTGAESELVAMRKFEHLIRFRPSHTLWTYGNAKMRINAPHDPIWGRVKMVEHPVSLKELAKQGKFTLREMSDVTADFLTEASGILNWALAGYADYKQHGLCVPECVIKATASYQFEQDSTANFMRECCQVAPGHKVQRAKFWHAYTAWCLDAHIKPKQKSVVFAEIQHKGFIMSQLGGNIVWIEGIGMTVMTEEQAKAETETEAEAKLLLT